MTNRPHLISSRLAIFVLLALNAHAASAQIPESFPISDRVALGAAIGVSQNADTRSGDVGTDVSFKVDLPGNVGTRVHIEAGHVGWSYTPQVVAPAVARSDHFVLDRLTVSLLQTVRPPVYGSRVGLYAGVGLGVFGFRRTTRDPEGWLDGGVQGLGGFEYVLPGNRRVITTDARLYFAGRSSDRRNPLADIPQTVTALAVSIGYGRRF
jgi:hypothetical protein